MRSDSWTIERVEVLRRLWAEGQTAVAIGARLGGLSRSAVLGKVFRLRLQAAHPPDGAESKGIAAARDEGSHKAAALVRRRQRRSRQKPPPPPPAVSRGKTLLELTNTSCRWPFGRPGSAKFHFCAAAEADLARGIPYCARHMGRAYPMLSAARGGGRNDAAELVSAKPAR